MYTCSNKSWGGAESWTSGKRKISFHVLFSSYHFHSSFQGDSHIVDTCPYLQDDCYLLAPQLCTEQMSIDDKFYHWSSFDPRIRNVENWNGIQKPESMILDWGFTDFFGFFLAGHLEPHFPFLKTALVAHYWVINQKCRSYTEHRGTHLVLEQKETKRTTQFLPNGHQTRYMLNLNRVMLKRWLFYAQVVFLQIPQRPCQRPVRPAPGPCIEIFVDEECTE